MTLTNWTPETIGEWHAKTFPNATQQAQFLKLEEEFKEYKEEPSAKEAVDIYIVCSALMYRWQSLVAEMIISGMPMDDEFIERLNNKMGLNSRRTWIETEEGYYKHVGDDEHEQ